MPSWDGLPLFRSLFRSGSWKWSSVGSWSASQFHLLYGEVFQPGFWRKLPSFCPYPCKSWASGLLWEEYYKIWENFHISSRPGQEGRYSSSLPEKGCSASLLDLRKFTQEKRVVWVHGLQKLHAELPPHSELKGHVVANEALLLTAIMELLGFAVFRACDAPSVTPSSRSSSVVTSASLSGRQTWRSCRRWRGGGGGSSRLHFGCLTVAILSCSALRGAASRPALFELLRWSVLGFF